MPRARSWTDEQLVAAVAASTTLREVWLELGVTPGDYGNLRRHIARLKIDDSHLAPPQGAKGRRRTKWSEEQLSEAVREEFTVSGVLRRLGYEPNGGMHRQMVAWIRSRELDTSHFTGRSWARGQSCGGHRRIALEKILVANSSYRAGHLRKRLILVGLKPGHCEECGLSEWRGKVLPLALDHINGDHCDHRLENLRILCPNCHALTETWCGRGRPA